VETCKEKRKTTYWKRYWRYENRGQKMKNEKREKGNLQRATENRKREYKLTIEERGTGNGNWNKKWRELA